MINVDKMSEGIHYELIPADFENDQAWDVRILKGDFVESVIRFGNVAINGKEENLTFNFDIISTPDVNLTTESIELQDAVGSILVDVIENAIADKQLVAEDRRDD